MDRVYEVVTEEKVMIPMRDGVKLAADIYFPAQGEKILPGPHPVILERTPYDRTRAGLAKDCLFFARRGYVAIAQDVRGRFDSEGVLDSFGPQDVPDGFDTCQWIGEQPWCNGKIGTMGTSYSSMNQAKLAMSGAPHLAAQVMNQGFSRHYNGRIRQGGALRMTMAAWIFRQAANSPEALADPILKGILEEANERTQDYLSQPFRRGETPLRHLPAYEDHIIQISTRGDLDQWWREPGRWAEDSWDKMPDVPRLLSSGWYDSHSHVVCWAYQELISRQKSPVHLVMGPWTHGSVTPEVPFSGEGFFGPRAAAEWNHLRLSWFDEAMRGRDTGVFSQDPVHIFVMGGGTGRQVRSELGVAVDVGGRWRREKAWPLERTQYTPFFFGKDLSLHSSPSQDGGATTFRFNPLDPVPTVGGPISSMGKLRLEPGAFDQRARPRLGHQGDLPLATRPDVLSFQTPPLEEGVEITGPIEAILYVSSSAPDTDFTVKLVDVYPPNEDFRDGVSLNVTDGILRVRYRDSWTEPSFLSPGQVVEIRVELPPTSLYFAPGHRIRVDVSSSNWPRFEVNPNTGEPVGRHRTYKIAENTLHHSAEYPSRIVLPVIPD